MKLLLVGNRPATMAHVLAVFAGSEPTVTRCADSSQAIAELHNSGRTYDWVILEGRGSLEEEGKIVTAVEALGLPVPVGYLDAEGDAEPALSLVCAAQRSADGFNFLRCALSRPGAVRIDYRNHGGEEVILEYQAPARMEEGSASPVLKIQGPGDRSFHQ